MHSQLLSATTTKIENVAVAFDGSFLEKGYVILQWTRENYLSALVIRVCCQKLYVLGTTIGQEVVRPLRGLAVRRHHGMILGLVLGPCRYGTQFQFKLWTVSRIFAQQLEQGYRMDLSRRGIPCFLESRIFQHRVDHEFAQIALQSLSQQRDTPLCSTWRSISGLSLLLSHNLRIYSSASVNARTDRRLGSVLLLFNGLCYCFYHRKLLHSSLLEHRLLRGALGYSRCLL